MYGFQDPERPLTAGWIVSSGFDWTLMGGVRGGGRQGRVARSLGLASLDKAQTRALCHAQSFIEPNVILV